MDQISYDLDMEFLRPAEEKKPIAPPAVQNGAALPGSNLLPGIAPNNQPRIPDRSLKQNMGPLANNQMPPKNNADAASFNNTAVAPIKRLNNDLKGTKTQPAAQNLSDLRKQLEGGNTDSAKNELAANEKKPVQVMTSL